MTYTVDVDPDPHVLAGPVVHPASARAEYHGRRAVGLGPDLLDPRP
jgi:hypothetical protein